MPWARNSELPDSVKVLPSEAQTVFRTAANNALARGLSEERAFRIGWGAVKRNWKKNEKGEWVKKTMNILSEGVLTKAIDVNDEQGLVFGWASVVTRKGNLIEDSQGDVIFPEDLEKAVYPFVKFYRNHGENHVNIGTGTLIESIVFTLEKQQMLGIDLGIEGWWVGFEIDKKSYPDVWEKIKKGEYAMFSIGGTGLREEVEKV